MTPRRILHVVRPASGGIRQHVISLVRHLDADAFVSSLAAPADFLAALPPDLPLSAAFPLDIAPKIAPIRDIRAARQMVKFSADIVHAHGLRAGFVAALAPSNRPLVVTFHNLLSGRAARFAAVFVARRASRIIVVSPAIALPSPKIVVIPNGVAGDFFARRPPVAHDGFVVGCLARLSREKGVDVLLTAARQMENVTFWIAGDGPEWELLTRDAPGNARFLGRVDDVRDVLAKIDALAVPSRAEGQGIAALEAMAAGVPIVASRVGGLAEMLTDGETALLVPPDDPNALAAALARLQADDELRARLSAVGKRLVRESYDVRDMARRVGEVYREGAETDTGAALTPPSPASWKTAQGQERHRRAARSSGHRPESARRVRRRPAPGQRF